MIRADGMDPQRPVEVVPVPSLGSLLAGLATTPSHWFRADFTATPTRQAGGLLLLGSLFYAAAGSLPAMARGDLIPAAILLANALGMTVLSAAVTWLVARVFHQWPMGFGSVLKLFSLASAPVLFVAWVPGAFLFTEPWKWSLVALGLIHGLGTPPRRAMGTVLLAAGLTAAGLLLTIESLGSP